jgi:succinate dehydrogenase (ubiquinone) iron-sulfur subunit
MKRFDIYRANPNDPADRPKYVSYYIDMNKCGPMFLDALIKIKDEIDPTLSFRRSCREGICGSCSMNIDGRHHLACICPINKENTEKSTISPLMFMFVLKDLVVDMSHFYAQYKSIEPYLKRKTGKEPGQREFLQSVEDRKLLDVSTSACYALAANLPAHLTGGTLKTIWDRPFSCRPTDGLLTLAMSTQMSVSRSSAVI